MRVVNWLFRVFSSIRWSLNRGQRLRLKRLRLAGKVAATSLLLPMVGMSVSADECFDAPIFNSAGGCCTTTIATADFNGDGIPDVVTGSYNVPAYSTVLLGQGTGGFDKPSVVFKGPGTLIFVATGDFDGDGVTDFVVGKHSPSEVQVFLGQGDGTFSALPSIDVCTSCKFGGPYSIAVGDFNGDGWADIAITNNPFLLLVYSYEVSVLLGKGDGTFEQEQTLLIGQNPRRLTAADFNGDGLDDLAVAMSYDVAILLGQSNGKFLCGPRLPLESLELTHEDFDGDGDVDLAMATSDGVSIGLGAGNGTFAGLPSFSIAGTARAIVTDDFNGDGIADLAISTTAEIVSVSLGNGDGTFGNEIPVPLEFDPYGIAIEDFNGDGAADLAIANPFAASVAVMLNQDCAPFLPGDVNQDGDVNLLDVPPFVELLINGGFQNEADINGDGSVDLLDVAPFVNLIDG